MFIPKYIILIIILGFFNCKENEKVRERDEGLYEWKTINVTASAYNSLAYQTNSNPSIGAFGDSLVPGMRCIAVSRDLLKMGLKHNTPVKIEGFDSIYLVKDKMNARWEKRIDIYMGTDVKAARNWGKKKVSITYGIPKEK
ncbi:3D domain-containing protein [Flavivirga spongiicola]|uniref:3D domain-containing protein n=1 Tax=Flavivirga spongiicola TaxID=421621 RepID=A0ABU7XXW3_9FLAO|nr:hypothetical protein [Flavivirga sp. MEBiC05379]MDO5980635.1 hypothetical protein [Flavivirga sp. MEBiC05379]